MRLIDADILIEVMDTWDKFGCDLHNRLIKIDRTNEDIVNCVKAMTTAYDINKVVEELEKNASRYTKKYTTPYGNNGYKDTKAISINKAIEIVKQGGVSDDVCEWKRSGDMARNPHTFIKYNINQFDGLYALDTCQYCRKKIKVVE